MGYDSPPEFSFFSSHCAISPRGLELKAFFFIFFHILLHSPPISSLHRISKAKKSIRQKPPASILSHSWSSERHARLPIPPRWQGEREGAAWEGLEAEWQEDRARWLAERARGPPSGSRIPSAEPGYFL